MAGTFKIEDIQDFAAALRKAEKTEAGAEVRKDAMTWALAVHKAVRKFEPEDDRDAALTLAADLVEWGWARGINMSTLFADAFNRKWEA